MSMVLVNEAISSVMQTLLFTLIPFIVWLITARKKESFFSWIGLKGVGEDKKQCLKYTLIAFAICEVAGFIVNNMFMKEWNISQYAGMGAEGIPCIILFSYVHTAFSEEILFRGFIQKRLQSKFGFRIAVVIQAIIFGLAHLLPALGQINFAQGMVLMFYPMIPAVSVAFVDEKKANGSILPGWLIHGTLNIIVHASQL